MTVQPTKPSRRHRALAWVAGIKLLRDPKRLDEVFNLVDALEDEFVAEEMIARARAHAQGEQALSDRYRMSHIDLAALRTLPEGTLGRAFAELCDGAGIDPRALPRESAIDDRTYLRAHLYETHDVWHTAVGFGTDIAGELAVQAFYLAQTGGRLPVVLITGGLLHALLFDPGDWQHRFEQTVEGFRRGRTAQPLFGFRWDQHWSTPLADVRSMLGMAEAV